MVSIPPNDTDLFKRKAVEYVILLGPSDGSKPGPADQVDYLLLESVKRSRGSDRVDAIVCTYDLSKKGRLIDTTTPQGHNRILEVRAYDREGNLSILKAWGVVTQQSQAINESDEYVTLTARQEPWLFGDPIYKYMQWNTKEWIHADLIFQPIIDDKTVDNKADPFEETENDPPLLWILDPESTRTDEARGFQECWPARWTLAEAVYYLFQILGTYQYEDYPTIGRYYEYPSLDDLRGIFDEDLELSDVRIPMGSTLADALDILLTPYGYFWYVRSIIGIDEVAKHYFEFAKKGAGETVSVYLQRPGDQIDNLFTNLSEFRANYNIGDLANRIIAVSSPIQFEATFELYKGWNDDDDGLDLHQLKKGGDESLYPTKRDVGRKWVLNEARDYDTIRPEIDGKAAKELVFNLLDVLTGHENEDGDNYKRRRFQECFSLNPDGESSGIIVEWLNADLADNDNPDGKWEEVEWPYSVLNKECGIYFEGAVPPDELWTLINEDPSKARIRVTAMVEGDTRKVSTVTRQESSPNGADVTLFLDLSSRFHYRTTHIWNTQDLPAEKITRSIIYDRDDYKPNVADDSTLLSDFAHQVRDIEDVTLLSCSLYLDGVDHAEYEIGKLIDKVDGRNLDLNGKSPDQSAKRLPQIVGINEYFNSEQKTELLLESFKEERPRTEIRR
ncbi:hypothetical protein [Gimesia chilikensis]|uniref:hypothetical protein n=1 Tax=Gimesia chilikensis TaxID=2605989 RepID=UPI00118C58BA|nr:hypothetical protein [Gimesia chilikensis]QDT84567.1 hypothetical protein MalM14_22270 [Gimesia chilikensis]